MTTRFIAGVLAVMLVAATAGFGCNRATTKETQVTQPTLAQPEVPAVAPEAAQPEGTQPEGATGQPGQ